MIKKRYSNYSKKYNNENLNVKSLNKIDIKQNDKSYENIKNIVLEKSKK